MIGITIRPATQDDLAILVERLKRAVQKTDHPTAASAPFGFAKETALTPTCYLDPNTEARKPTKEPGRVVAEKKDQEATPAARKLEGE